MNCTTFSSNTWKIFTKPVKILDEKLKQKLEQRNMIKLLTDKAN